METQATPETAWRLTPKWQELKRRASHFDALVEALDALVPRHNWGHEDPDICPTCLRFAKARAVLDQIAAPAKEE